MTTSVGLTTRLNVASEGFGSVASNCGERSVTMGILVVGFEEFGSVVFVHYR